MHFEERLDNVTERAVLFQVLKDVQKEPEKYTNVVETLCTSMHVFSKFLTDKELTTVIQPLLDTQPTITCMVEFCSGLTTVTQSKMGVTIREVMIVLGWLKYVVEKELPVTIVQSLKAQSNNDIDIHKWRMFAKSVINLPDKISNCCAKAQTEEHVKYIRTVNWIYKMNLLQGIQKALLEAQGSAHNLTTVSELISDGRNLKLDEKHELLDKIIEWIGNLEDFGPGWEDTMRVVFQEPTVLGVRIHEALLTAVFMSVKTDLELQRCISTRVLTGTLRRVVMVKLPFQRVLKPRSIKILVNFVHRTNEGLGFELLETALKIWADSNFAKRNTELQEKHIVRLIVHSIFKFRSAQLPWNALFLISMNGIHARMGMLPIYVQSALFVNSTLGSMAHVEMETEAEDKPKIPDYPESQWTDELKRILDGGLGSRIHEHPKSRKNPRMDPDPEDSDDDPYIETVGEREDPDDPDPESLEDEEEEEEEDEETNAQRIQAPQVTVPTVPTVPQMDSDDEEEDFPNYQVEQCEREFQSLKPGEEPRHRVPPPSYIQDAFEGLLEKTNFEVFEASFFSLKAFIDRKSIGLVEIAESLFIRVIHLSNHFGTENFDEIQDKIAISTIVQRPEIVPAIVRLLIAPGQSFALQHKLLNYIHMAADEMGALDKAQERIVLNQEMQLGGAALESLHEPFHPPQGPEQPLFPIPIQYFRDAAEARIQENTRMLGTPRTRPQAGVVNRLAKAAKYMFYPLLVVPRGEHARLLREDSDLLAYIITVASMVYVRCGINPAVCKMSTDLIDYVAPHRFSENAKLRTACLAAHMNVLALLPDQLLCDLFPARTRQEWVAWTHSVLSTRATERIEYKIASDVMNMVSGSFGESDVQMLQLAQNNAFSI